MPIRRCCFIILFEMVFLLEILQNSVLESVLRIGFRVFLRAKNCKNVLQLFLDFWADLFWNIYDKSSSCTVQRNFTLKTILKYLFLVYLENRFYSYFIKERVLITILISFEKIIQRYCFYFLGTLSRDNILFFTLEIMLKSFSYFILEKDFISIWFRKGCFSQS